MIFFKPKFNTLALDVGDASIEALILDNGSQPRFYQRIELPDNTVVDGVIMNEENFVAALKALIKDYKKRVVVALSLPESKVFIYCFDINLQVGDDIKKIVDIEIKKVIPWQEQEIYADFISKKDKDIYHIVYVAAPKPLVNAYQKACISAGLELVAVNAESFSLGHALLPTNEHSGAVCILDIGARITNVSIFDRYNMLALSVTVPIAGQKFTAALAQDKKMSLVEAEIFKKKGENFFDSNGLSVYPTMHSSFEKLTQEAQKAILYFEKKTQTIVDEVILAGGSSLLNGLDVFLSQALNKKTTLGDPLKKISNPEVFHNGIAPILFADVIGQAIIAGDNKMAKINLLLAGKTK